MGNESVKVWVCDVCGHRWIAGELVPTHCASSKCRSRKWDSDPVSVARDLLPPGSVIPCADPKNVTCEEVMQAVVARAKRPDHDAKSCRVYKCGLCAAITNDK